MSTQSFKVKSGLTLSPVDLTTLTNPQAGDLACDINDSNKIKRYDANASSWTEVGSGGVGNINALLTQTFDTATLAQFTQTGLALSTSNPIDGIQSARLIHQPATSQSFKQVIDVDRKYRGELMQLSMQIRSSASNGNLTLLVTDETNSATIAASQSISTASQTIASLVTNATTTVSGFSNSVINGLAVGMTVTGSGIATGTLISTINTTALTITLSQAATASATVSLNFSALPDRRTFSFTIPANCASMSYTITALQEANLPESYIDDVVIELASTALLTTSVDVPNMTAWQGYTPTFQGFGTPTNIEFEWRQVGENAEIRGKFASGTSTAVEARIGLPAGLTSAGTSLIPSIQSSGTYFNSKGTADKKGGAVFIEPSVSYVTLGAFGTFGTTAVIATAKALGTSVSESGDSTMISVSVPCSGLSATSTKTIALTQSGLVQHADSNFEIGTPVGASTNTLIRTFSGIFSNSGDAVLYTKNATLGDSITILKDGVYNINYSEGFTTAGIGFAITKNYAINTAANSIPRANVLAFAFSEDAVSWVNQISFSGKLVTGDVIRFATGTNSTIGNAYQGVSISYQGSLKQVSVSSDQKITIPTSELRFEGASTRGSTATAIVKFDTLAKIRGDAFTVTNTAADGTYITMLKAGKLDISTSIFSNVANQVHITRNQSNLTALSGIASEILSSEYSPGAGDVVSPAWSGFVNIGDIVRVNTSAAISALSSNNLNLSFQEQEIAVSVTNTLPQFSESDSSVRVDTANGYGSAGTKIRRFSNVRDSIGVDVEYLDSATNGASFTVRESGTYAISYTDGFTSGDYLGISKNAASLTTNITGLSASEVLASGYASTAGATANASWQGYLVEGDIIRPQTTGTAASTNAYSRFTISKVGKPNVTGVDVTPFVQTNTIQSQVIETWNGSAAQSAGTISSVTASINTLSSLVTPPVVSSGNLVITALNECTVNLSTRWKSNNNTCSLTLFKNGVNYNAAAEAFINGNITPLGGGSAEFVLVRGDTITIDVVGTDVFPVGLSYVAKSIIKSNPSILTAPETFSTDTAALQYAPSTSYTLTTLNTAPVGTYITFTYAINTNTRTQTSTRPTQTDADMNANGMLIYTRAYNAASIATQPTAFAIQIGKGLKGRTIDLYKSAAKTTAGALDFATQGANDYGIWYKDYDEKTGILLIDAGVRSINTNTASTLFFTDNTNQTSGYLVINASKNPALTGIGLSRVGATYYNTTGTAFNNGPTTATFTASLFDSSSAYNTGTGFYTVPENGIYTITTVMNIGGGVAAAGTFMKVYARVDSTTSYLLGAATSNGGTGPYYPGGTLTIKLNKGQTIDIRVQTNTAGTQTQSTALGENMLSIAKVSV